MHIYIYMIGDISMTRLLAVAHPAVRQTDGHRQTDTDRHTDRETDGHRQTHTDRQTDIDRHTDSQKSQPFNCDLR